MKLQRGILDICVEIHRRYGPGLLESFYEEILCYELTKRNIEFVGQYPIVVIHDKVKMNVGFRVDIIVEAGVLLELKSVSKVEDVSLKRSRLI